MTHRIGNNFEWQMSWRSWGLQRTDVPDFDFEHEGKVLVTRYLIVGPLQMRWKTWQRIYAA